MLFDRFFKRRKKKSREPEVEIEDIPLSEERKSEAAEADRILSDRVKFEKENIDLRNTTERLGYIERLSDTVSLAKGQCEDIKFEYGRVTSYLKDIQLIDTAPEESAAVIRDSASRIVELTEMRKSIRRKKYRISEGQRKALDRFEDEAAEDVNKLLEYEDYQVKIRNDLRRLSAEKNLLESEKQDIIHRQTTLKRISLCTGIILGVVAVVLVFLLAYFRVDIVIPFIAAAGFAFLVVVLILNEARKNRMDMVITEKKQNKAVALTNQVKIRYVNNVRTLEYLCAKYQVRGATELDFVYSQYKEAKREWARQREGTIQIEENHEILINELKNIGVRDREIWFTQAKALIDPSEMVEVRHDLNTRRQRLREQLDYNTSVMTECLNEMEKIRMKKPEYAKDVERVLMDAKGL